MALVVCKKLLSKTSLIQSFMSYNCITKHKLTIVKMDILLKCLNTK